MAPQPIEIFRTGTHQAMSGEVVAFSASELGAVASAYDPSVHEAPLVVGHPATNAPAYGWVARLDFANGRLTATPDQVDPQFAELVKAGRFKKVSASFYKPTAPGNPKPGSYYLRHVGFLGAAAPAVKGLRPVQFADEGDQVVVFGDWADRATVGVFRRMRDFMLAQFGQDQADRVFPSDVLDALGDDARQCDPDDEVAMDLSYAERAADLARRERELEQKSAAIKAREDKIAGQQAEFAEGEKRLRADANATHLDKLVKDGRMLPAWKSWMVAFLERLEPTDAIEFGEGRAKTEIGAAEAFRQFLDQLPVQVSFAEVARTPVDRARSHVASLTLPPGFAVDEAELELRDRALAYAEQHKIDFLEAVRRLEAEALV